MIRNTTLFSFIAIFAANSCFAGRSQHKKERRGRAEKATRMANAFNLGFDDEKPIQVSKNPVHVRSYVKKFNDFTADELETLMPIMVELLNDHLLGRIDLMR